MTHRDYDYRNDHLRSFSSDSEKGTKRRKQMKCTEYRLNFQIPEIKWVRKQTLIEMIQTFSPLRMNKTSSISDPQATIEARMRETTLNSIRYHLGTIQSDKGVYNKSLKRTRRSEKQQPRAMDTNLWNTDRKIVEITRQMD